MANRQGLGQFAGAFARSFGAARGNKQDREQRDEIAKQQAKLVEMALASGKIQLNAQTTLADLMTGTVQEFESAEPVITPGGREIPQFTNTSGEDALGLVDILSGGSPEGQLAALQSGAVSGKNILDFQVAQDQLAAIPDISKLFSGQTDASGNPMMIPVGITIDSLGRPSQQFGLNPEFNTAQQDAFSRLSLSQLTTEALEIMDIESELAGSLLESGFPFGGQARTGQSALATIGGALGFDTKAQKQAVAKRDRVEKLYGQILGIRMQRLSASGESITNDKLAFLQSISPDTNKSPDANAKLLADFLQEELNKADIESTKIPAAERKKVLDFIRKARSGEFLQTDQEPIIDTPGLLESAGQFASSTMEQLEDIIPSLPPEQIEAFEARLEQLKQQTMPLVEKVRAGLATAKDFAELTIEDIKQINQDDIKNWTKTQVDAFNKRRKELGL